MSSEGSRIWLALACLLIFLGGCASGPAGPARPSSQAGDDGDENWLWKSITGQKKTAATEPKPNPAAPGGVQQASATVESSATSGQWVAGPSSHPGHGVPPSQPGPELFPAGSDKPIAGPPPSIPAELPAAPEGAVSIKDAKSEAEQEKKGFEWSDLAPENLYKNIKKAAGYGPNEKIARAAMQEGKTFYGEKKYKEAADKFATAADRCPDTGSPLEEDALYLKGESEFFSDQYPKAHDTYGGLLKKYTNTRYLDTVAAREFALGRYWEQLQTANPTWVIQPNLTDGSRPLFDTFGYAVQAYERVRMHDPTGPLADASLMALGNAYFRRGQWENAAFNYDLLRKEYPNSKYQMSAHLLCLQAKMRIYQGATYDQGPLKDAHKIADQTLKQFGDKLGPERDRVAKARAQIIEEEANRDFVLASYYDDHKCYGAARMYYQSVIDGYPTTDRAKQSLARMQQIRSEPDNPPDHFKWLTAMFESTKQVR
jgi:outer membrane protein assembly factor BamD (BamD/ComL family)